MISVELLQNICLIVVGIIVLSLPFSIYNQVIKTNIIIDKNKKKNDK